MVILMLRQGKRNVLRSIFIGLGGAGNEIVRRVKRELLQYGYDFPVFQYLVLDTISFNEESNINPLMKLRNEEEYLYIGGANLSHVSQIIESESTISGIQEAQEQAQVSGTTISEDTGPTRSAARTGLFHHFGEV